VTKKPNRRSGDARQRIVDAILATRLKSRHVTRKQEIQRFLQQYFASVPYEDLEGRSEEIMARIALDHLDFAAARRPGEALLRIYNPTEKEYGYKSQYTFIEMVNDDMPFLVDSVAAAIKQRGLGVHITVHPIIAVRRNDDGKLTGIATPGDKKSTPESFIRFAISRETDDKALRKLCRDINRVLADIRVAVRDWAEMRQRMRESSALLKYGPKGADPLIRSESQALLEWMVDDHFTFLGYREYRLETRQGKSFLEPVVGSGLGLLSRNGKKKPIELTTEMERLKRSRDWLILTKANSISTVHRPAFLDYVGIKLYDKNGKTIGERRFIGLLTSIAYNESPTHIPLLRYKVREIFRRANVKENGHRGKALLHIIQTYPREELFQSSISDLTRTTIGILNLQDRQRVRLFLRRDPFHRFFSCLVFVPREKYTTAIRRKIEALLKNSFAGISVDSAVQISDSALARVHIIVRTPEKAKPRIAIDKIEHHLAELLVTWSDRLRGELLATFGNDEGERLFGRYGGIFPAGFQEDTPPKSACADIQTIDQMLREDIPRQVELYTAGGLRPGEMRFIVYSLDGPLVLSDALPILERMGAEVHTEHPYEAKLQSGEPFWIQDFHLCHESGNPIDVDAVSDRFEECFMAVLSGEAENDGLNRLIVSAELSWREVALVRCYAKHILQLRLPFSQSYMENVLVAHANLARHLVRQFEAQFDPALSKSRRTREYQKFAQKVERGLSKARNVDEDRILSAFAGGIAATLRSNFFLTENGRPKSYISIKLDPSRLPEVPRPRPKYEVFVYSPEVEGVHLRGGDIARGGLRWSDRREDFRTEVLGLMKAQVVKNTIIVPTGAKGGFFPKRAPQEDRKAILRQRH
jgi:glutamate dehydrogenase